VALPDLAEFLTIPGLKPPLGQHWTWWVLWLIWTGFWIALLGLAIYVVATKVMA
jgi:hypothetical protein